MVNGSPRSVALMLRKLWRRTRKDDLPLPLSKRPLKVADSDIEEREAVVNDTEAYEIDNRQLLADFESIVYPVYKDFGYSKDTALLAFMLDCIGCHVVNIKDRMPDGDQD